MRTILLTFGKSHFDAGVSARNHCESVSDGTGKPGTAFAA